MFESQIMSNVFASTCDHGFFVLDDDALSKSCLLVDCEHVSAISHRLEASTAL